MTSTDLTTAAARRTELVLPEQVEEAPAVGLLHHTRDGTRILTFCIRCGGPVGISHGSRAPFVDPHNYTCLRCRA